MNRIETLKEYLEKSPADSFLIHALALEYIKAGDDAEARKIFERALHNNPDYVATYYHLAKLLERNMQEEEAVKIYEKGMEVAQASGDRHSYSELRSAYEQLIY